MFKFSNRTWAEIDLSKIKYNYELAGQLSGNKEVVPVIKANAYGHGAVTVGKYLEKCGAELFAVATLDEAKELIDAGIKSEILILGAILPDSFEEAINCNVIQTVATSEAAKKISATAAKLNKTARLHIKVDTGMGRIGFNARNENALINSVEEIFKIASCSNIELDGIFTHCATADIPDNEFALHQHKMFDMLIFELTQRGIRFNRKHISNSGDIVNYPVWQYNTVREGIILYGYLPDKKSKPAPFKPAMSVYSKISHIYNIEEGESVGYGRTFTASKNMKIAVIPIGYADGYSRALSNKGKMLVNNNLCSVVGRVCMDQTMIDVTGIDVNIGDTVTVLGDNALNADGIAELTNTISYEVLCNISPRVTRVYINN